MTYWLDGCRLVDLLVVWLSVWLVGWLGWLGWLVVWLSITLVALTAPWPLALLTLGHLWSRRCSLHPHPLYSALSSSTLLSSSCAVQQYAECYSQTHTSKTLLLCALLWGSMCTALIWKAKHWPPTPQDPCCTGCVYTAFRCASMLTTNYMQSGNDRGWCDTTSALWGSCNGEMELGIWYIWEKSW